jgi:hypothetical protein
MNIFASLPSYAGHWSLKSERSFDEEEIKAVSEAVVVPSQYGNSVCFTLVNGQQSFIPLSRDATKTVGEHIDLEEAKLQTLCKPGEKDILRVAI